MQKKRILSLLLAVSCSVSLLTGCGGKTGPETNGGDGEHEAITMTAMVPFRNPATWQTWYTRSTRRSTSSSGYNATAYAAMELAADEMTDIYFGSMYAPAVTDVSDHLLDMSAYPFTDNFTDQRLREVTDDGHIYMLPLYYSVLGITYNKTLLDEHGWTLPTSFAELEELAPKVEAAGCDLALNQGVLPGYGFQYFCNVMDTSYLNTLEGRKWQNDFLDGTATVKGTPALMEALSTLEKWKEIGMLDSNIGALGDAEVKAKMAEGNTLFMLDSTNNFTKEESDDEFGLMPYLSEDGTQNSFILNVSRYVGLNKQLEAEESEQKLEDALHVMEVICTVDGMRALSVNMGADVLVPLKDFVIPEESVYKPIEQALNEGYVAPYIYTGWENVVVPVGEKMFSFMKGECDINAVLKTLDDNQYLLRDNSDRVYTTVTKELSVEDCAKLVGIQFTKASGADVALVSTNKWYQTDEDVAMNTKGVQCPLYAMPITDQELTAMLPTGWTGTIQTVTLTGTRVKELAETGYDKFGDGEHLFPYDLVMPDGVVLEDDKTYTVVICGASKAVQEEGSVQDTGIVGLTVMQDYLSRFDTFSPADITWN